jgi:hypothetical protein
MSGHKDKTTSTGDTHIEQCMKVPFVQLMRLQHCVRWSLMKMGARTYYKADIDVIVLCGICRRDCYVAHVMCNCRVDAICLCHGKNFNIKCRYQPVLKQLSQLFCLVLKRKRFGSALAAVIVLYL